MAPRPNEPLIPEKRLLVCCARTKVPNSIAEEIRQLASVPLDWDLLFVEASNHSVAPLLCRQLSLHASDLFDSVCAQRLQEIGDSFALRNLRLTAELLKVVNQFQSAGIQAIPYKGPVLAAQAYGDLALREFEDLDIVLRQRDITTTHEVMVSLGYRPKFPWILSAKPGASFAPAEYSYRNDTQGTMIELHTERTLRHFPLPANIDDLAARLMAVSVGGQNLQTFSPEDALLLLSIHGSKHFWQRLSWIADVSESVQSCPQLDWDQVFDRARTTRANRILAVSLVLALRLFAPALPRDVLARIESDSKATSIAQQIERQLLSCMPREANAVARFHLRRDMLEGWLEGWRYSLRLTTLPSDEDWSAMRLPSFLAPLHAVVRPFRLLRKYRASAAAPSPGSIADRQAPN